MGNLFHKEVHVSLNELTYTLQSLYPEEKITVGNVSWCLDIGAYELKVKKIEIKELRELTNTNRLAEKIYEVVCNYASPYINYFYLDRE